ncbi:hypothetical protein DVH05_014082 [Phytophthora capsici]|nr:hypothetical protein DVH05_014082 [Phytophthora capsici]
MPAVELRGFSADRGRFLLTTARTVTGANDAYARAHGVHIFERDFVDFQAWDRFLRRNGVDHQRLPIKRLRKLMTSNWVRGDRTAGWRVEMQKSVSVGEDWINAAFEKLSVAMQQEFLDDDLYVAARCKRTAARADSKHARDLQQYFSSAELVDLVVKRVMEHLQDQRDVVWLEPSCGDGRFLTAMLRAGARHVVGYEIDERLHDIARNDVRQAAGTGEDSVEAQVYVGDFLTSKSSLSPDKFIVAIGNPPFGAKGGDGSDLVHHFFRHSAKEWRARVIAFIVPERCSRPAFVETTLQQLQSDTDTASWTLVTELSLTDHQFEFGTGDQVKHVRQPSVLQLFERL